MLYSLELPPRHGDLSSSLAGLIAMEKTHDGLHAFHPLPLDGLPATKVDEAVSRLTPGEMT